MTRRTHADDPNETVEPEFYIPAASPPDTGLLERLRAVLFGRS